MSLLRRFAIALTTACILLACEDERDGGDAGSAGAHDHDHDHDHDVPGLDASTGRDAASDAGGDDAAAPDAAYALPLPAGLPRPIVPDGSGVTEDRVQLGRMLFYDTRLSGNGTQSCGSCHQQALAFTDGRPVGIGSTGQAHVRGAMSLANVAYASSFTWANAALDSLESQALVPLFGESPVELGLAGKLDDALEQLRADPEYPALFARSFGDGEDAISLDHVVLAIASFERALISGDSPYDRFVQGRDPSALGPAAQRGMDLFFSEELECFHCHGGFNFSGAVTHEGQAFDETTFHNNGLYNLDGRGAYPEDNTGLYAFTGKPEDMGRFKAPTLRNIARTAPYMHDGSIATLSEVIEHYARGGRLITDGPYAGDGRESPVKSEMVANFAITEEQKADLLAFLESLTDEAFLTDPRFSDPFADAARSAP